MSECIGYLQIDDTKIFGSDFNDYTVITYLEATSANSRKFHA